MTSSPQSDVDDDTPPSRYDLRPSVEKGAAGYTNLMTRLLLGVTGLGVAGKLGELAFRGLETGHWIGVLIWILLLVAGLGMSVLTVPLFIFAAAGWVGDRRFNGRQGFKDPIGIAFSTFAVLIFASLVYVLMSDVADNVQATATQTLETN
ncbi:MAG: hypothetical protein ABJN34_09000 [Litoreibacter sp.]|uniref:hypothetical protein n=1 Tax=Litoreibacter sp. TaxID=1969459 RepID=UPI003299E598